MTGNLPKPIKKQREVLYMPATGHSVVLGTAGSGKTTLALYRAAYLSKPSMPHSGKTLLLTFNTTLVTYLNYLKPRELKDVQIETYHKFARGYLNARNKMGPNRICSDSDERERYISQAVETVESNCEPSKFFKRPLKFFMDEIQWIFGHGITSGDQYLVEKRVGRTGTRLSQNLRPSMYQILEKYIKIRNGNGKTYDWDDIALHVRRELKTDSSPRFYKHIVIDEGQDFSPEMIRSLVAAIPEDGSLSFFGDVAQQIYGQRMSWRSAGLEISQPWLFRDNYRNTKQISQLGLAISRMPFFKDIADMVEPVSPRADGPLPAKVKCEDEEQQIQIALESARDAAKTQRVAILVKDNQQADVFSSKLGNEGVRLRRELKRWNEGPGIYHGTYHSAKGLEFDMVIIPFLDSGNLPDKEYMKVHGEEDALTHYGRLLYVAITRAKTRLVLLYSDILTPLLNVDKSLCSEVPRERD